MPLIEGKLLYRPKPVYVSELGREITKPVQWSDEYKDKLKGELLGREFAEEVLDEIEEVSKGRLNYVRAGNRDVIHEIILKRPVYQVVAIKGEIDEEEKEELIKIADESFL
jgi:hypothetical protein